MIIGVITVGSLLLLIGILILKVWNISERGQKYNWVFFLVGWGASFIAIAGLTLALSSNIINANTDADFLPDVFESSLYLNFGWVMLSLNSLLTIGEAFIYLGVFAFPRERGKPNEKRRSFNG